MNQIYDLMTQIHQLLDSKKALDLSVIEIKKVSSVADYFIICTGTSSTHIKALSDYVEKELAKEGITVNHKEGMQKGEWILLDYQDIVVHIFNREKRDYYGLERIWNDAPKLEL